jgi:hypothetical protein
VNVELEIIWWAYPMVILWFLLGAKGFGAEGAFFAVAILTLLGGEPEFTGESRKGKAFL